MRKTTLMLGIALTLAGRALAGAPLVTEAADGLARGHCELEAAVARESGSGLPALRSRTLTMGCGVTASAQAALNHTQRRFEGSRQQAPRPSGKSTFAEPGGAGWGPAYGIETAKAAGSGRHTETWDIVALYLREMAPGRLARANPGRSRNARQGSTLCWLGTAQVDGVTLATEVFGGDRSRPGVAAGVGFDVGHGFCANVALARQFSAPRVRGVNRGAKLVFRTPGPGRPQPTALR